MSAKASPSKRDPVVIVGAGLSGLCLAIALTRLSIPVEVYDKVSTLRDAGSGMSVIGHCVDILESLGVNLCQLGIAQTDVSLRSYDGKVLFQVPLQRDPELTNKFGSSQFNVHRGELQAALLRVFEGEGQSVRTGHRLRDVELCEGHSVAVFENGHRARGCLLVGADGINSVVRRKLFPSHSLRYSGASCWRGISTSPSVSSSSMPPGMFKTVTHKSDQLAVSFTGGLTTKERRFWVCDVEAPEGSPEPEDLNGFLVDLLTTGQFDPKIIEIVATTPKEEMVRTDVYDSNPPSSFSKQCAVLIGDSAHPLYHHFGQGACLGVEDAIRLAECIHRATTPSTPGSGIALAPSIDVAAAIASFDSFSHRARTWFVVLMSRFCGDLYMASGGLKSWLAAWCLAFALMWPLNLLFTFVVDFVLFRLNRKTRTFAKDHLQPKAK